MASFPSRIGRKIKNLSSTVKVRNIVHSVHQETAENVASDARFFLHSLPQPKLTDHSPILLFPQIHISTLPNGIRVATQTFPSSATHTASIGVWIDAGSRFEIPGTNGTAHFLEHMIFKGTRCRTATSLEEEIENMGARLNAYTSREQTTFYADVQHGDVPIAIDILADILQNSKFSDYAIRWERGVILREMEEVRIENDNMPLVYFAIAFKGASWTDPNSIPLMVIQSLLGTWNKGQAGSCSGCELAYRVSIDNLAEQMMAFNTNYWDTGLLGIYFTAMPTRLQDLSVVVMQELRRLASQVSEEEVIRARNKLKAALLLHIDGSSSVAENNGRQMLTYGRVVPFFELFARIDAVDSETIKETARNFIIDKDIVIAALGPIHQLPDYGWFRSQTCMM